MVHKLDKLYQLPSRVYFSQVAIPELYKTYRQSVMQELSEQNFFRLQLIFGQVGQLNHI